MKKISMAAAVLVIFFVFVSSGCEKAAPTAVAATATTVATLTGPQQTATVLALAPYSALATVPGGTFTQQSDINADGDVSDSNESFSHTISAFKIGKYEVTYELWYIVKTWADAHDYSFANAGMEGNDGTIGAAPTAAKYEPVTTVSWRDVMVWCNAYSEMSLLTPCYTYTAAIIKDSSNTNATACDNAVCTWSNNGFRLPTEGERQYAASWKGTDSSNGAVQYETSGTYWTPYNYASGAGAAYTDAAACTTVAWYDGSVTHDTGGKQANVLGIYDMSGNVYEWCWDWWGTYPGTSTDYKGIASGSSRVIRGGSYDIGADYLQVGSRNFDSPYYAYGYHGFRLARTN